MIAGPGQWVDINEDGAVTVDGQVLSEPYITELSSGTVILSFPHRYRSRIGFLWEDNRETSVDSRSTLIGDISSEQIEGQIYPNLALTESRHHIR